MPTGQGCADDQTDEGALCRVSVRGLPAHSLAFAPQAFRAVLVAYASSRRQVGLIVRRKRPRKGVAFVLPHIHAPLGANMVWAYHFILNTTVMRLQLRCLTGVDEFTR